MKLFLTVLLTLGCSVLGQESTTVDPEKYACVTEPTLCQLKEILMRSWSDTEERLHYIKLVAEVIHKFGNATWISNKALTEELHLLKGRQAVAGALQVTQFVFLIVYILTLVVMAMVKCFKKKEAETLELQLVQMEARLQERKKKSSEERKRKSLRSVVDDQLQ